MKKAQKDKAILLRIQGLSYNEIVERLSVSKGSLSSWLRDIEIDLCQKVRIKDKILNNRIKFLEYNIIRSKKAEGEKQSLYNKSKNEITNITKEELKLTGIGLYWAEGYKANLWKTVSFSNSDPKMIVLMMRWFREICDVKEEKFRVKLQIHDKAVVENAEKFWAEITRIPLTQFTKSTIKISKSSGLKRGNILPYGTVQIRVSDTKLLVKIKGWIDGLGALSSSPVQDVRFSI